MARKTERQREPRRVVLVGTYRGDQLKDWPGWYCWPQDGDVSAAKNAKAAKGKDSRGGAEARRDNHTQSPQRVQSVLRVEDNLSVSASLCEAKTDWLSRVAELWLYRGTADERRYRAEFVGVKTREELIRDYGCPCVATTPSSSNTENVSAAKKFSHGDTETQSTCGGMDGASSFQRFNVSTFQRRNAARPHSSHYALFKTELIYRQESA